MSRRIRAINKVRSGPDPEGKSRGQDNARFEDVTQETRDRINTDISGSVRREYSVNLPLGHTEPGELIDRAAWPLHVTIQSNVTSDADPAIVIAAVSNAVANIEPLHIVVGEQAYFGPDGSILVNLVRSTEVGLAHDAVNLRLREDANAVSINPSFDGDGYHAHVTATSRGRAKRGDELVLRTVLLVEVGPNGDRGTAKALATFPLRASAE